MRAQVNLARDKIGRPQKGFLRQDSHKSSSRGTGKPANRIGYEGLTAKAAPETANVAYVKQCTKCGKEKPLGDYNRYKRSPDGRQSRCRDCVNAYARAKYAEDPTLYVETRQAWDAANREKRRGYVKKHRDADPERARRQTRESLRKMREANPDYYRDWYQRNIEQRRADSRLAMRQFRKERPEAAEATRQRYRLKNREAIRQRKREIRHARRACVTHSADLAELMAELVKLPCLYCGDTKNITIDHIVPLARGGKHEANNLAPACRRCNSSKCDRLLSEWPGRF
jgi:5-methylcytosine-specific restriction endonuclease McrA